MVILVLSAMLSVGSAQEHQQSGTIELSMMDKCIDDSFTNCNVKMDQQVKTVYFPREIKNPLFREAWDVSEECALEQLKKLQNMYQALTSNHTRALCIYTNDEPILYVPLNAALRTGAGIYSTPSFKYHALYFWLVSAIQILKNSCETTYRRTNDIYTGKINQNMRFGYFASSSRKPNLLQFGNETCFHIRTCHGAYIEKYSIIAGEDEVLIPPYEVFKVTKIVKNSYGSLQNCKKIFVLESVGTKSNLNCKATNLYTENHNEQKRASFPLIFGLQLLIALLWNYPNKTI